MGLPAGRPSPVDGEMASPVADPRGRTPLDLAAEADDRRQLARLLAGLDRRHRAVVATYFGLPGGRRVRGEPTYRTVGKAFGVSKERVRQIVTKSLERMRDAAADADRAA